MCIRDSLLVHGQLQRRRIDLRQRQRGGEYREVYLAAIRERAADDVPDSHDLHGASVQLLPRGRQVEPHRRMLSVNHSAHPGKPIVIETLGDQIGGLALAHDHVVWSVPYTYGPNATTTEERLKTQKTGFVATTALPN